MALVGNCQGMCPTKEIKWREKERLLHRFELLAGTEKCDKPQADPEKVIKEYSRPAAGQKGFTEDMLRPSCVLRKTVEYLIRRVVHLNETWASIYYFVSDRLRAVCQDMTIQAINDNNSIVILETATRFYIYSAYKLCEETAVHIYDPHINTSLLMECLKRLLVMYAETESKNNNMMEMVSYYLLFNLGSSEAIHYALALPCKIRKSKSVLTALKVNFAFINGNYFKVLKWYQKMPVLSGCCLHRHVELIRSRYLQALSVGFNCKTGSIPVYLLSSWLEMANEKETENHCAFYGVKVNKEEVFLSKSSFNQRTQLKPTRESHLLNERLKPIKLSNLISGSK